MENDIADIEFENALSDKRHKEIASTLKTIASLLSKDNNEEITQQLKQQAKVLGEFISSSNAIAKDFTKDEKVVNSILKMGEEIKKGLSGLQKSMDTEKKWTFEVKRGYSQLIETIIAKQTN